MSWRLGYYPHCWRSLRAPYWGRFDGVWAGEAYTVWFVGPFELWRVYDKPSSMA